MPSVNIYLTFDGNCKQAFEFYQSVFGGEFPYVGTFGEMPAQENMPAIPDDQKDRIMHMSLPIGNHSVLMGSDTGGEWAKYYQPGTNFSISVTADSMEEADRIYQGLSQGGIQTMPMSKTFWESYFGMLTDAFGINWQISFELATHKQFEDNNS